MTNQIIKIEEAKELARELAPANTLPAALKQKPADLLAVILTGAELGLAPMQAVRGIQIIQGKPTLSADAMGALVKRSEACEWMIVKESTNETCTIETKRRGYPSAESNTFTMKDAMLAGLNGDNWRKYPKAMLRARCLTALCRSVYPDIVMGIYDPDEISPETKPAVESVQLATSATLEPKPTPKVVDVELRQAPIVPQASKVELPPETTTALASVGFEEQRPYVIQSGKNKGKTFREVDSEALKLAFEFFNAKVSTAKTNKESQSAAAILAQVEREIARRESEQTNAGA